MAFRLGDLSLLFFRIITIKIGNRHSKHNSISFHSIHFKFENENVQQTKQKRNKKTKATERQNDNRKGNRKYIGNVFPIIQSFKKFNGCMRIVYFCVSIFILIFQIP